MKIVYGNPKTAMSIGVALLGDKPTPFFGFVDRDKIKNFENYAEGMTDCSLMISHIEAAGGVIVYIENPDAAERLTSHLLMTFASAIDTDWGDIEQAEAGLQ
jgi:hypothetical protein